MRIKSALAVCSLSLLCSLPRISFADTLTLIGASGGTAAGIDVYPYQFTVAGPDGTQPSVDLSCLNFNREITFGETWAVDPLQVSTIDPTATYDGELGIDYLEDAWLYNQYNTAAAGNSEIQFAIWSIMDPAGINASNSSYAVAGAFDATSQALAAEALTEAISLPPSAFTDDYAFLPDPNGSSTWTDGQPQIFMADPMPPAVAAEPSSIVLLGTGLLGGVFMMRRKLLRR